MTRFLDNLHELLAREAAASVADPDRMGDLIGNLSEALGTTIAIAARGDGRIIPILAAEAATRVNETAQFKAAGQEGTPGRPVIRFN